MANLPPTSTTPVVPMAKFAASVVDTGGKFATGVIDTDGAPSLEKNLCEFSKQFEMTLIIFSGAWRKMINEKNLKQKIL